MAKVNPEVSELPVISFTSAAEFSSWLERNETAKGLWIRFFKKGSGRSTITYVLALDEALCYGWIDGQLKKFDEDSYLQKFTPRRTGSIWSKRNIEHVERLTREGRMKASGLKEAESARIDGRWSQAYDSPSNMSIPDDFMKELSRNKKALAFFNTLNKANTYAIGWRLQTAKKAETKQKRIKTIIEMLARGEKFH